MGRPLTPRQRDVTTLILNGHTNGQIAAKLDLSIETVKTHVSHILSLTGARNRRELVFIVNGEPCGPVIVGVRRRFDPTRIAACLREANMTRLELSRSIYVNVATIDKWKSGRVAPSIEALGLLADLFGKSTDDFYCSEVTP